MGSYLHLSTLTAPVRGGLSLLHFSWGRPRRVLPVILALWSPDFPHVQAFRPARAAVQLTCRGIVTDFAAIVNWRAAAFHHNELAA